MRQRWRWQPSCATFTPASGIGFWPCLFRKREERFIQGCFRRDRKVQEKCFVWEYVEILSPSSQLFRSYLLACSKRATQWMILSESSNPMDLKRETCHLRPTILFTPLLSFSTPQQIERRVMSPYFTWLMRLCWHTTLFHWSYPHWALFLYFFSLLSLFSSILCLYN